MPSQYWTVAKIVGESAVVLRRLLQNWEQTRSVSDRSLWAPEQWPVETRVKVDAFAEEVRRHAIEPPTVYFAEWFDGWSSAANCKFPLPVVMGDRYEVYYCEAPLDDEMKRGTTTAERRGQHQEDRRFAKVLLEANDARRDLLDPAIVIMLRCVVGGLVTDDEIEASLESVAAWVRALES